MLPCSARERAPWRQFALGFVARKSLRPITSASCLKLRVVARSRRIHTEDALWGLPLGLDGDYRVKISAAPSLLLGFQFRLYPGSSSDELQR